MTCIIRTALVSLAAALVAALLGACSSHDYNPTTMPYQIDRAVLAKKPIKKVIIATANVSGEPTRYLLQKPATRIDSKVKQYLEANGYQVAPSYQFENAYSQAVRTYGNLYDPTSGRVDPATWRAVMVTTMKALQGSDVDAVVFTDVIERDVSHNIGMDHMAQWDGVSRKPGFSSAGAALSEGFDWNRQLKAASLVVTVYTVDLEGVFTGRGGLDTLQVIDTKASPATYVRRKKILDNDTNIDEGVEIALHPFIPMKNYPGKEEK
ncbi:MAG: hypothetical protein ABW049_08325 [Spongiibacteraceae bacterium]